MKLKSNIVDFTFACHAITEVSDFHGVEIAIGALSKKDIELIIALIQDEEYFKCKYYTDFYLYDDIFHTQGVFIRLEDKYLKSLKDKNHISSGNVSIRKIQFDKIDLPQSGAYLISIRNEDTYFVSKGTANCEDNNVPIDCYVKIMEILKPLFGILDEIKVNDELIDRDGTGIGEAKGNIYDLQQILFIDGKPQIFFTKKSINYPLKRVRSVLELNDSFLEKEKVIRKLVKLMGPIDNVLGKEVNSILLKLENQTFTLDQINEKYRFDPVIVAKALELDGTNLEFVNEKQRGDKDLVRIAVNSCAYAFKFADNHLKNDLAYVKELLKINGNILEFVSESLRNNYDIAIYAVSNNANSFKYLSKEMKKNESVIQAALNYGLVENTTILEYLPAEIQDSKEIVKNILLVNGNEIEFASNRLKNDKDCLIIASKNSIYSLSFISDGLKEDLSFFFEILELTKNSWAIEYFSDSIKDSEEALLAAAKYDACHYEDDAGGAIIKFASERLRNSKTFILEFIKIAPYVLDFISRDLRSDKDIRSIAKKY